jgi:transposase InsO family protein
MRQLQLKCCVRLKRYRAYQGSVGKIAPNRLNRHFNASQPNVKWVTDVTEFKLGQHKLYLSAILDLYNREIISYQLSPLARFDLVKQMLGKAFVRLRNTDQVLLHSDQGWQYQTSIYQNMLSQHNLIQSMSRKGNCLDNAVMENFFGIIKSECFDGRKFDNITQLAQALKKYIHYYNHERIKLALGGLSPVAYRMQAMVNTEA